MSSITSFSVVTNTLYKPTVTENTTKSVYKKKDNFFTKQPLQFK